MNTIKKIIEIIYILLPFFKKNKKYITNILISVIIALSFSQLQIKSLNNKILFLKDKIMSSNIKIKNLEELIKNLKMTSKIWTIENLQNNDNVISFIDQNLLFFGTKSFISWMRIEKINDKYILYFKDVQGIIPNGTKPISLKNTNALYQQIIEVDSNTIKLIQNLKEFEVRYVTKQECIMNGFNTLFYILDNTNLKFQYIKLLKVNENNNIIWIFSLYTENDNMPNKTQNDNLSGIAKFAKTEILE
jgi:hypothetical protein